MASDLKRAAALPTRPNHRLEMPTLLVAGLIYTAWVLLTAHHASVPLPLLCIAGGILIAWHGSLQHETIHGHPTHLPWFNAAIGFAPLSLWLPYATYRRTHIAHHATPDITDPFDDPESQYLARGGGLRYWLAQMEACLLGRLIVGPPIRICCFLAAEIRRIPHEPVSVAREWAPHLCGVTAVMWWLDHVDLSLGHYLLAFVYPGTALSLLRSFAEHRADSDPDARAAIIARPGALGLLYLNNNLHAVHHARPGLAWYRLPDHYRRHQSSFDGGPHYANYGAIIRRHLLRPHDDVIHPVHGRGKA